MSTLMQAASVNGRVISNNDPDMVIVLDSNPGVQISSIQDDSITYAFIGEVTEDTVYSLDLTFTYKQKHKLIVPVQLTHKNIAITPELNVTNLTDDISLKLWESTIVNYDVMLGDVNINSSITDVVLELTEEIKADLEFVKQEDGFWNVKAIHGQTAAIFWTIPGNIYVTHQGSDYILPISVKVTVEGNDGSIPVNRFDVTFL